MVPDMGTGMGTELARRIPVFFRHLEVMFLRHLPGVPHPPIYHMIRKLLLEFCSAGGSQVNEKLRPGGYASNLENSSELRSQVLRARSIPIHAVDHLRIKCILEGIPYFGKQGAVANTCFR